jgi:hypothetical protein
MKPLAPGLLLVMLKRNSQKSKADLCHKAAVNR